jgi:NADP-dependent 3-hydroxy acid dehydrogenase YdfG
MLHRFDVLGHTILGCGRTLEGNLKREFEKQYPRCIFQQIDVTNSASVDNWARQIEEKGHIIDVLMCNSGVCEADCTLWDMDNEAFDSTIDVNIKGTANVLRSFLPSMVKRQWGLVVTTSSGLGRSTYPTLPAYCASKFAVEALTKCVAQSLPMGKHSRMAAVPLAPGVVKTAQQPFGAEADKWAIDACDYILGLADTTLGCDIEDESNSSSESFKQPSLNLINGASLSVPGYYTEEYTSTWVIKDGMGIAKLGIDFGSLPGTS